jgi:D-beta-D-heptose 7-phosphate kinase/D-beta-D-heptose 1-phosphate adenosyltransferase
MTKVFVNGTFDVLHSGHLYLLEYAKSLGDYLLVAIDDDARVKIKKGNTRPVNSIITRTHIINSLKWVDKVTTFNTDEELENTIKEYEPDVMVVGSDWKEKNIIGSNYSKQLIFFDRIQGLSTTNTSTSKFVQALRTAWSACSRKYLTL